MTDRPAPPSNGSSGDHAEAPTVFYDRDPASALASKVRWCKRFALLETVFYALLIPLMYKHFVLHQDTDTLRVARKVVSYFHGMVVSLFAFMAWDIQRLFKWSWPFFAFAMLPIGSLFAHHRLRGYESSASDSASSLGATPNRASS